MSDQAENKMIDRLAVECGHNVVSKIKVMFEDMVKSKQMVSDYKKSKMNKIKDFDFNVEILSYSSWPSFDGCKPTLPPSLSSKQDEFK